MNIKANLLVLFIILRLNIYSQNDIKVNNINEYNKAIKIATPGTNIILKNGIWKDVHLKAYGKGSKENPITIKAETAGKVIVNGNSKLQIYGEYIVVEGLWFKDGEPSSGSSIVSFKKNSDEYATNCRFTNNTISNYNPVDKSIRSFYLSLWGKNNRVDHNNMTGKNNQGTTLVVWLKGVAHINNNHRIDNNYFGPRPELGKNGGETIRIGTSKTSLSSSNTLVEENTFKECNGDIEIISNKSGNNIYRNNLFIASKGTLTLRHGKNALIERNVFLGQNIAKTGGIRITDEGHVIKNNLLVGLKGTANSSPIAVMHGVPNSPLHRYKQVKNVSIQNNTLINCSTVDFATSKDKEKTLAPIQTLFANNLITNTDGTHVLDPADDITGIFFKSNVAETSADIDTNIFKKVTIDWKLLKSLPMPTGANKNLLSEYTNATTPKKDINGNDRNPVIVGAFNLDNTTLPKALTLKSGPNWKPNITNEKQKSSTIIVEPGTGTLYKAMKDAVSNSKFQLKDGIYLFEKSRTINGNATIMGTNKTVLKSAENLEKPFNYFFKVNEKSALNIKNLTFDGEVNNIKYAITSPSKNKTGAYSLVIDNCHFRNFNNEKGSVLRGYTNTLAQKIVIRNSSFINSTIGLNYHSSKNTPGTVNVKSIKISNSIFKDIKDYAIKYKGDEVSFAANVGNLQISNSVFSKIGQSEKGKFIMSTNISNIMITKSVFENSSNITSTVNLKGAKNTISDCLVYKAGKVKASKGAIAKNIIYESPKWSDKKKFIPGKKSPLKKLNNNITNIGLIKL